MDLVDEDVRPPEEVPFAYQGLGINIIESSMSDTTGRVSFLWDKRVPRIPYKLFALYMKPVAYPG